MKAWGVWAAKSLVEAQHDHLVDAATLQFGQLVAQGGDARGRVVRAAGTGREEVARMGLEGQHAGRRAAMPSLVDQQRQHGLVAAVHAVEVADRQRAGRRDAGVMNAAKDLHGRDYCGREVLDGRA